MADPQALVIANAAKDAYDFLGSPEGELAIAEAVIYMATAPKSNASYAAFGAAMRTAKQAGSLLPPKHILNAPTKLMQSEGYGRGYAYDHDAGRGVLRAELFSRRAGAPAILQSARARLRARNPQAAGLLGEAAPGAGDMSARTQPLRLVAAAFLALLIGTAQAAAADIVEVAPGISVSKKKYDAPANEQPFFGFVDKTQAMRDADAKFVTAVMAAAGGPDKAAAETLRRGWVALASGNLAEAGRRFNQAYLVDPGRSGVYHSFAVLAAERFHDPGYAEELFKVAKTRPHPLQHLNADYGRFLLILKRPRDAQPLLEQAVLEEPNAGTSWSNLGFARFGNGDRTGACKAADEAARHSPPPNIQSDLQILRTQAQCK